MADDAFGILVLSVRKGTLWQPARRHIRFDQLNVSAPSADLVTVSATVEWDDVSRRWLFAIAAEEHIFFEGRSRELFFFQAAQLGSDKLLELACFGNAQRFARVILVLTIEAAQKRSDKLNIAMRQLELRSFGIELKRVA